MGTAFFWAATFLPHRRYEEIARQRHDAGWRRSSSAVIIVASSGAEPAGTVLVPDASFETLVSPIVAIVRGVPQWDWRAVALDRH